ncbi:MAG: bifunctional diguanylate cyclase/phosphodiesterase [Bryobacterales bacterium]|nr:bifunctional diguanylate cyclase/phosphodiesterase [Bryobacterales bacterium]
MAAPTPGPINRQRQSTQSDALTGLMRGGEFTVQMERMIGEYPGVPMAVLVLGLDRFRHINELLGYGAGDEAIREAAARLSTWAPFGTTLGRLGGDQFAAFLPECEQAYAALLAGSLIELLHSPAAVGQREIFLSASIGLSQYPEDGQSAGELLRGAAQALVRAKERGGGVVEGSISKRGLSPERRYQLEQALRSAMERDEFVLRYQPQVDRVGQIWGMEALISWHHAELGRVDTEMFIRLAEEIGMISAIGEWVLSRTCRQIREWRDVGLQPPRVAVNVSPVQFSCAGFVERVRGLLAESGISGEALELEVTEGTVLRDIEESAARMVELRALGIRIAIDDFGVGYSPLAYLNQLPLDVVKIDRSFIRQITQPSGTLPVVHTITVLAHHRGMKVVAEGVETEEELELVYATRCDAVQGFLISPPVGPDEVVRLLLSPELLVRQGSALR